MKDYDFRLNYYPSKANVVTDALSRKSLHMLALMVRKFDLIEQFRDLSLMCEIIENNVKLGMLKLTSSFLNEIKEGQKLDLGLIYCLVLINQSKKVDFRDDENMIMRFQDRVCVPEFPELKKRIIEEGHRSSLRIHLRATKMYQDLKKMFCWSSMKKDYPEFGYACLTWQKSKIEYLKSFGLMQPFNISE